MKQVCASSLLLACASVHAQTNYPSRVVTLVNPFSPGASTDVVARVIAQKLTEAYGLTVVVENRVGASGMIGLASVARAPADGHTLAMMIITHATTVALQGSKSTPDIIRDFSHITQVVSQPYSLVVNPSLPVRSIKCKGVRSFVIVPIIRCNGVRSFVIVPTMDARCVDGEFQIKPRSRC